MADLYMGIETGGTKVVAGIARLDAGRPVLVAPEVVVPTTDDPGTMLDGLFARLSEIAPFGEISAIGIGSFGPVDLEAGVLLPTPKAGWSEFPLVDAVRGRLNVPIGLDTDVNAAALGESRWGAARGASVAVYLTVGTGIGGGLVVEGVPVHGLLHPEMGHIGMTRRPGDDYPGACGVHGSCFEGLVAGPAIEGRRGMRGEAIPDDDPVWAIAAWYLGRGLAQIALTLSPEIILLGGGVMRCHLYGPVAESLNEALQGYVPTPRVVAPHFGARAGLMGAFAIAAEAARPAR